MKFEFLLDIGSGDVQYRRDVSRWRESPPHGVLFPGPITIIRSVPAAPGEEQTIIECDTDVSALVDGTR